MGREVRRVPVGWTHPRTWARRVKRSPLGGRPEERWVDVAQPLHDKSLAEAIAEWEGGKARWEAGHAPERELRWREEDLARWQQHVADALVSPASLDEIRPGELVWRSYEDYAGERPTADACWRPEWPPGAALGFALYENVSEGTPITPTFETEAELVAWLVEKGTAWDPPCSREVAERLVGAGFSPTMVCTPETGLVRGLEVASASRET